MKRLLWMLPLLLAAACTPGEGDRCNPMQFSSDCNRGFSCVYKTGCAVAYCCPDDRPSTNPNCQTCPTDDAGADASTDDGGGSD
jgi:hypothetical protein